MIFLLICLVLLVGTLTYVIIKLNEESELLKYEWRRNDRLIYNTQLLNELFAIAEFSKSDIRSTVNRIFSTLHENTNWRAHSLYALYEDTQTLSLQVAIGLSDWYIETLRNKVKILVGDACIGRAVAVKRPVAINNVYTDPRFTKVLPLAEEGKYKGLMAVPLVGRKGKIYGSFCTYSKGTNEFHDEEIKFLSAVGNIITTVIERTILISKLPDERRNAVLLTYKEQW